MAIVSGEVVYQVRDLRKQFGSRTVVAVESLTVRAGEMVVIVGPNGAGKSTLLRMLHFLEAPTGGAIEFLGEPVSLPAPVGLRRKIGMVFQRPELLAGSVRDNICYPMRLRGIRDDGQIDAALDQLRLMELAGARAGTLSGGELQRVALARALVTQPKVLLLDEPTANLDPHNVELIEGILQGLHAAGTTMVMVTHNVFQARRLADRVGLILNGQLVETAETEAFFENPGDSRVRAFVKGEMVY